MVVVRQGIVQREDFLSRLWKLAGWCVLREGRRGLRTGIVKGSSHRCRLRLAREVGATHEILELVRCKLLRCQRGSRCRMRQRVVRGLKDQGQGLGIGLNT